jgi:hypothetical protein
MAFSILSRGAEFSRLSATKSHVADTISMEEFLDVIFTRDHTADWGY